MMLRWRRPRLRVGSQTTSTEHKTYYLGGIRLIESKIQLQIRSRLVLMYITGVSLVNSYRIGMSRNECFFHNEGYFQTDIS
jgi:hypothetical protein